LFSGSLGEAFIDLIQNLPECPLGQLVSKIQVSLKKGKDTCFSLLSFSLLSITVRYHKQLWSECSYTVFNPFFNSLDVEFGIVGKVILENVLLAQE
jgi:hypothetical protein